MNEEGYLDLLRRILDHGEIRKDRTGTGTKSLFGEQFNLVFDLTDNKLPIITTKKVEYEKIIKELLFFISGKTDTKILENQNVYIWKGNTSKQELDKLGLNYEVGDAGPIYGFQWRHWNAEYKGCHEDYTGQGIDQLQNLINLIKNKPESRRLLLSAWNVSQIDEMCLPPCHVSSQFYISFDSDGSPKYLDCMLFQRSADCFLGLPFNITSYCLLTYMIAHITGLKPRKFTHCIGDAHIYLNHIEQCELQLKNKPNPFPLLSFKNSQDLKNIDDFKLEHFIIENYICGQKIEGKMSV